MKMLGITYASLMVEIERLESENEKIKAENEKLREFYYIVKKYQTMSTYALIDETLEQLEGE